MASRIWLYNGRLACIISLSGQNNNLGAVMVWVLYATTVRDARWIFFLLHNLPLLKQYLSPTFFLLPLAYYHQVGAQLVGGDIDMVAMTGSSAVGKKVDSLT